MKRTKDINQEVFRKSWRSYRLAPVALAIGAVLALAGCEQSDQTVSLYKNADECSQANPGMGDKCTQSYNNALKEAEKTAPKYATREDCIADFGEAACTQSNASSTATANNQPVAQAGTGTTEASAQGGSSWMPLMAGYMMGRMMGGSAASQPLFTSNTPSSPANGKFVDASGKSYGAATTGRTMNVPPSAMAPKPATTTTTTRGGFGESVNKQAAMQRSSMKKSSSTPHRSMGG